MVPYSKEAEGETKHFLKQIGKKYVFAVKNLNPEDAGIYQVDVEGVNVYSTDFKSRYHFKVFSKVGIFSTSTFS